MSQRTNPQKDVLERPILIIGAARSGTQLLSRILAAHPDIAYLDEPSFAWRRGRGHLPHEMYPLSEATPNAVAEIRDRFRQMCVERGRSRIAEKTPANCLRLGFGRAVMPDAMIVHLIRDGREVAVSVRKKFEGDPEKITRRALTGDAPASLSWPVRRERLSRAFRSGWRKLRTDPPGLDLLFWLPELGEQLLAWLGLRKRSVWGPRIPGIRALLRTHSTLEVAAIQWRTCVEAVLNYRAAHPEMPYLLVRYEDLCREPQNIAKQIFEFCQLDPPASLDAVLAPILRTDSRSDESELDPAERAILDEQSADTIQRLGNES
jgi:hypothetical protein